MPSTFYRAGDPFSLQAEICSPDRARPGTPFVVMLDVGIGEYWFYPSWAHYPPDFDYLTLNLEQGSTLMEVIPEFPWPAGAGSMNNVMFHGAILDPGFTQILGRLSTVTFGFDS